MFPNAYYLVITLMFLHANISTQKLKNYNYIYFKNLKLIFLEKNKEKTFSVHQENHNMACLLFSQSVIQSRFIYRGPSPIKKWVAVAILQCVNRN